MATLTRTDIHRPSAINPDDYDFVGCDYCGEPESFDGVPTYVAQQRALIREHMASTGGSYSTHEHGGSCHICGAWAASMAVFWHAQTSSYILTGFDCAAKMGMGDPDAFKRLRAETAHARQVKAGKMKARATLAELGLSAAWDIYAEAFGAEPMVHTDKHASTIRDIVGKLIRYGDISEAQVSYLRRLVEWSTETAATKQAREAARQAEHDAAAPVPVTSERIEVEGEILSVKFPSQWDQFPAVKLLIRTDAGYRLWGSRPSATSNAQRGDRIAFTARVEPSQDDPKFGFWSRPTKARITHRANPLPEEE